MKLNNHGWGLREMLVLSSILLCFLLVAIIMVMRLYNNLEDSIDLDKVDNTKKIDEVYYHNLEYQVQNAGVKYFNNVGVDVSVGEVNVSLDKLIDLGYITRFKDDITGNYCDGYVKIYIEDEILNIDGYINCDNYRTEGYVG